MVAVPDSQNTLLSFLYHVSFNRAVRQAFHASDQASMNLFNLSDPVRAVLNQLGQLVGDLSPDQTKKRTDLVNQLCGYLAQEFLANQVQTFW